MIKRRYPIGAEVIPKKGVDFRVWAPDHSKVTLVLEDSSKRTYHPMQQEEEGYFSILIPEATPGTLYRYQVSNSKLLLADPASRFQPEGPLGPSCVIDPTYPWEDQDWQGISEKSDQIIYEIHIGTFTEEGTFQSALKELEELANLGITLIEIMPLNDFSGNFGWGYDGVNLFAPCRLYGTPEDLKQLINRAHQLKLGVLLDVVYNHLGPEGNQMLNFSSEYLTDKKSTDWGDAINFDSIPSRDFFLTNVQYWIEEYHFDGLRVDATSCIYSSTPVHVLADLTKVVRKASGERKTFIVGENEPQDSTFFRPYKEGGYEFDALWNDDFHHTASARLTGRREAYYTDYLGSPQEFISSLKYGFLYQGQYYRWQKKLRGTADLTVSPSSLVIFLENHDQVANSGDGKRLHQQSHPGDFKALTCLLLLSPNIPMLFQGQEYNSSRPFYYFADHEEGINRLVRKGRKEFLSQFPRLSSPEVRKRLADPSSPRTFMHSKLDFKERERNIHAYALHKDLIKLRKTDPVFKSMAQLKIDGAVLDQDSFLIRYFGEDRGDRLLIINFGTDYQLSPCPEPLLVAGKDKEWELLWSSEAIIYEGQGITPLNTIEWNIPGHAAFVLKSINKENK